MSWSAAKKNEYILLTKQFPMADINVRVYPNKKWFVVTMEGPATMTLNDVDELYEEVVRAMGLANETL